LHGDQVIRNGLGSLLSFEEIIQMGGEFWAETNGLFNGVWELGGMRCR
jgi:hypothetical protein